MDQTKGFAIDVALFTSVTARRLFQTDDREAVEFHNDRRFFSIETPE